MTGKPEDDAEFGDFYAQTSRSIWAYLSRASGSNSVADDLLQETYFRYLKSDWQKVARTERRFYLFRIGANALHDHFRQQKRLGFAVEHDVVQTPGRNPALKIDLGNILKNEMTERETELLWLAYAEEFSHREIAQMTDLGENSIRPLLFRAREKLAGLLTAAGYRRTKGTRS
jgi:RNA polymerase sigma-70 factor (ECF subfamily)